ncbi:MAG: sigma-54 dependent transcriptional regulator [candidate division WOR-3 bacterium]|nr:sigma-54 dependent transcriptional regulator [candidate division WOR-3 bacterium]
MHETRILIADDDENIRKSLSELLTGDGHYVLAVEDGYAAIEAIACDQWDLVILDVKMPKIDGLEVLKRIKESNSGADVIIITGYSTVENAVAVMKTGAADYIVKPFTPDEIRIRIRNIIDRRLITAENIYLRRELEERFKFENIIGKSKAMQEIFRLIEKVAPTDSTILIRGQSGTGKELIARAIHQHSLRKDEKFIAVDCGALPETLLESELFGHVKGSFTGAIVTKSGLLEVASGGTFFLDEIGDLSPGMQAKMLRVLQEKEFRQVGGVKNIKVDIRLVAATNQDLEMMIKKGMFREDLFYRINIVPIHLPPLRERQEDIPLFVDHFLKVYNERRNKRIKGFTPEALRMLIEFHWPGNVRELENIIDRMVIMSDSEIIDVEHVPIYIVGNRVCFKITAARTAAELKELKKHIRVEAVGNVEKAFLTEALRRNEWNVSKAARDVGMQRQNFQAMMRKHDIRP